ncbi:MlaE family ABC transporter permease [Campylobacter geochelonis]|uniref:MlaE family ABC transporter permease n=1 Tax=Campylobacter geochelonis TaxID=1780362 RepID=UPI00077072A5|nr:ABC transporter permease [Campylobacter geochelonis]CZE48034.1 stas domain-containing protein [Campylobacter geochelonis]CZE51055.1 stas domain-containing protein [Campylobacter geochelonis]
MNNSRVEIENNPNFVEISLVGDWTYKASKKSINTIKNIINQNQNIALNLSSVTKLDYAMAIILHEFELKFKDKFKFVNSSQSYSDIFKLIDDKNVDFNYIPQSPKSTILEDIGKSAIEAYESFLNFAYFIGELFSKFVYTLLNPSKIRLKEVSNHCKYAGINAIFIVCLTCFLIGVVLVYIGAGMLSRFGASIYVIEIMGMLTLRELGPLIAAIVMAGRSASSFTAQIGVMKITEEIDAMKTMSFDPFIFLVMPRIIAMVIITPLVIFLADMASLAGQILVANWYLDISFSTYVDRFKEFVGVRHFIVGMIKAPFFGLIIALVGCFRGFEVKGNTQSLGTLTTTSVVNAIFWVIAIDAIFAIFFSQTSL